MKNQNYLSRDELVAGLVIEHQRLGRGVIESLVLADDSSEDMIRIQFDEIDGSRELLIEKVKLKAV